MDFRLACEQQEGILVHGEDILIAAPTTAHRTAPPACALLREEPGVTKLVDRLVGDPDDVEVDDPSTVRAGNDVDHAGQERLDGTTRDNQGPGLYTVGLGGMIEVRSEGRQKVEACGEEISEPVDRLASATAQSAELSSLGEMGRGSERIGRVPLLEVGAEAQVGDIDTRSADGERSKSPRRGRLMAARRSCAQDPPEDDYFGISSGAECQFRCNGTAEARWETS